MNSLDTAANTVALLMKANVRMEDVVVEAAVKAGLWWRCLCSCTNSLDDTECGVCGKARLWAKDVTPPRYVYGDLLEDLRAGLKDWFDERPHFRRPAAVSFRITSQYDDGLAWATDGATLHYTDHIDGVPYREDFERSWVADSLIEIDDFDRPISGDTLRVVVPPPFAPEPAAAPDPHDPAPGTEYPYVISDYAREAARVLGPGWGSESGYIGAYGKLWGPGTPTLRVYVDEYDDLVVALQDDADPHRFTVDLPNGAPTTPAELRAVAEDIAAIIRANYL